MIIYSIYKVYIRFTGFALYKNVKNIVLFSIC